jgi:serine/threonine protein kinase
MRSHKIKQMNYSLGTTAGMTFDEVFAATPAPLKASATMDTAKSSLCEDPSSPYYDDERRRHRHDDDDDDVDVPDRAPMSPCSCSEDGSATLGIGITGERHDDVEDRYHVHPRVIGSGHHGSVRECVERATGRRYAIKSIRKDDAHVRPDAIVREIALLRETRHRGIVGLVDVVEDEDYVHVVTELCRGGELYDGIIRKTSDRRDDGDAPCFAEDEAARVVYQILSAVSYMHEKGIVHRDIKPENVLFETSNEDSPIKIIDFGLSRKHFENAQPPMSAVVGTPYYIAPEVLDKKYDKACDLWSVGIVAYILLCGYPPFNGANNEEVYDAVRRGRYRFHSEEWSRSSRESRDFVRRLLRKNPLERMTARQAMDHPWMRKHVVVDRDEGFATTRDEGRQDVPFVEVVLRGSEMRDTIRVGEDSG